VTSGFLVPGTVRTSQGLMRADVNAGNRVCGCGQTASAVLYVPRRHGLSNRVPLCPRHLAAHDRQVRARAEAIWRWWRS
jgi:hypothetical protein